MKRLPAVPVYYAIELVGSFAALVTFTVTNVYYVREIGMTPLQLVLCGTAMELAIFVFEVPTGVVADTVSRRLSVVVSFFVIGSATVLFGLLPSAPLIIAAYALWGLGYTFQSGALEAWIADEVGDERITRVLLRGAQFGWAGALLGVCASVAIAVVDLRAAIIVGGLLVVALGGFLALAMPETAFRPGARDGEEGVAAFVSTARRGARLVRATPLLVLMIGIAFFFGLWSESFDRLWQAQMLLIGAPAAGDLGDIVWIGVLTGVAFGIGILTAELAVKRLERATSARIAQVQLALNALLLGAALAFALAGVFWLAVVGYVCVVAARSLVVPLGAVWMNRTITDSSVRATVLSMASQADAVGQVTGGPAIGAVGTAVSLRAALALGAAALAPALVLYGRAVAHHGREPALEALPPPPP